MSRALNLFPSLFRRARPPRNPATSPFLVARRTDGWVGRWTSGWVLVVAVLWVFPGAVMAAEVGGGDAAPVSPPVSFNDRGFGRTVTAVTLTGNRRIETTTIVGALSTQVGQPLRRAVVRRDVESIFALGFFADVRAAGELDGDDGVRVQIQVVELPVLTGVAFEGNRKVLDENLSDDAAALTPGAFLAPGEVLAVRRRMLARYGEAGFLGATVVPVQSITPATATEGATAELTFVVDEGEKTRIREVAFVGAEAISESTLARRIKTSPSFWLTSWLTGSGVLKTDQLEEDLLRLDDLYQDRGYPDVVIGPPRIDVGPDGIWQTVTFPITEGRRYRFGAVRVDHADKVPEATLSANLAVRSGATYNRSLLRLDYATLIDRLGANGYIAEVRPELTPDPDAATMDVTYHVAEGEQVRIHRINILGNTKTRDHVIRREVRQQEGEVINTSLFRRSLQRINNLNFFENVDIETVESGPGLLDLDIRVKEKSTGQFSIGGGFSSLDGLVGLAEITQGNWGGRGQTISGRVEKSGRRTEFTLRFREPSVYDSRYALNVDAFNTVRNFESYEEGRTGGGLTLGRTFGEYVNASVAYVFEALDITITDVSAPSIITAQAGSSTTSSMGLTVARDTRDNFIDPRRGMRHVVRTEVAGGPLGGSNAFVKGTLDSRLYIPTPKGTSLLFRNLIGVGSGLDGRELPPGERFFVGGIRTVRGFDFGEAGPIGGVDPVGGTKEWAMTAEWSFPLVRAANLKAALFVDWGSAFERGESFNSRKMNLTMGWEIRWISPLGPLRFGFGRVVENNTALRQTGRQFFTIGSLF